MSATLLSPHSGPPGRAGILGWPPRQELPRLLLMSLFFSLLFNAVYWGADYYAGTLATRHRVDFAFEAWIPFLPWMSVIYLSISPLLMLLPCVLRSAKAAMPVFATLCTQVVVAGLIFMLFPVELGYRDPAVTGLAAIPFSAAKAINLTYNNVPSLHVAFSMTAALVLTRAGGMAWRQFIWVWTTLIVISTLLTHQHHLVDVAAGAILSWATMPLVLARLERRAGPVS